MDCFVASLLAMTADTASHSRDALRPRFAKIFRTSQRRGRRECRMRAAPAVSCAMCTKRCAHEHTGSAEAIRHSLRNGFTAYNALSPEYRAFLPPSPSDMAHPRPVGPTCLRRLDANL